MSPSLDELPVLIRAERLITPDKTLVRGWLMVEGGAITGVGEGVGPDVNRVDDLGDVTLAPGFVDLHVHGGGGHSLTTSNSSEIAAYGAWAPTSGVTSFLATVVATDLEDGIRNCEVIAGATGAGANLLGVNLEGPFLSPNRPGAIPQSWITQPDVVTLRRLRKASGGKLRVITVAPEVDGAEAVTRCALELGLIVSVGHTDTDYEGALAAFEAGASHVTHAFNAMRQFHHRDPGPIGAALDSDGVTIEVIADGVHLHPSTVRMLVRAFGSERVALITDATPLAGYGEGSFRIAGTEAHVRDGRATLADGTIAGSVATMDQMVRNVVGWGVCELAHAVRMASTVPAGVAGAGERKGRLAPGFDADIVALDPESRVVRCWAGGKSLFDVKNQ